MSQYANTEKNKNKQDFYSQTLFITLNSAYKHVSNIVYHRIYICPMIITACKLLSLLQLIKPFKLPDNTYFLNIF